MTAALRPRFSVQEYVEIEDASMGVKHEYVRGEIYAMAGGTPEHAALASALSLIVGSQLRGGPCRTYSSDLRISIAPEEVSTYADLTVICGPPEREPGSKTLVTNPRVVFEVLSPSTERYDREQKRLYYQRLDSLDGYVLVSQDRREIECWLRDDGWNHTVYRSGETAILTPIGVHLQVDAVYSEAGL